jgi:hypothetical protein
MADAHRIEYLVQMLSELSAICGPSMHVRGHVHASCHATVTPRLERDCRVAGFNAINRRTENMTTHIGVLPLPLCQFLSFFMSNNEIIDHLVACHPKK